MMKELLLIFISMLYSTHIFACNISIDSVSNITFTWDGTEQAVTGNWQLSRDQSGNNDCRRYHIAFTPGNSVDFNRTLIEPNSGTTLNYNLYRRQNQNDILKDHPFATRQEVIRDRFSRNGVTDSGTFEAGLPTPPSISTLPAGTYSDTVEMKVYKGNYGGTRVLATSENVNVTTIVPSTVEMSIVDAGTSFLSGVKVRDIDFGTIDENVITETFDILVQSNANFTIKASSQNNGELAHSTNRSYTIPYSFFVNNISQSLSGSAGSPVTIGSGSGPSVNPDGSRFPLKVEISNNQNTLSGLYQDVIQITVETSL
jgi:spore coat protein U-like protein